MMVEYVLVYGFDLEDGEGVEDPEGLVLDGWGRLDLLEGELDEDVDDLPELAELD